VEKENFIEIKLINQTRARAHSSYCYMQIRGFELIWLSSHPTDRVMSAAFQCQTLTALARRKLAIQLLASERFALGSGSRAPVCLPKNFVFELLHGKKLREPSPTVVHELRL
jgi:hypothetical protein